MFCTIYRWLISRSMDTPGRLSQPVARHVGRCPACRAYRQSCIELGDRLADEAAEGAHRVSDELHARILLRCGAGAEAAAPTAMPRSNGGRLRLGLAVAVAASVLVALAAWQFYPGHTQTPTVIVRPRINPEPKPKPDPIRIAIGPGWLGEASSKANDAINQSIDDEFERLRESGRAAAGFVLARMPIDIDLP